MLQAGGAVYMGLEDASGGGSCSATPAPPSRLTLRGRCHLAGNAARLQGGALAVQSGSLLLQARLLSCQKLYTSPLAHNAPADMGG